MRSLMTLALTAAVSLSVIGCGEGDDAKPKPTDPGKTADTNTPTTMPSGGDVKDAAGKVADQATDALAKARQAAVDKAKPLIDKFQQQLGAKDLDGASGTLDKLNAIKDLPQDYLDKLKAMKEQLVAAKKAHDAMKGVEIPKLPGG